MWISKRKLNSLKSDFNERIDYLGGECGKYRRKLKALEPQLGDVRRKREQPDALKVRLERVEKGFKKPQGHVLCPDCQGRGFDEYERYGSVPQKIIGSRFNMLALQTGDVLGWNTFTIPCQTCTGLGFVPEKKNRIELAEEK